MKNPNSPVFQKLYEEWRKSADPMRKARMGQILMAAAEKEAEITKLRMLRAWERKNDTCRPEINGTRLTGNMHPLEAEACRELCPALQVGLGSVKTKGWEWVMRQPWAQDLKTSPLGRQFY